MTSTEFLDHWQRVMRKRVEASPLCAFWESLATVRYYDLQIRETARLVPLDLGSEYPVRDARGVRYTRLYLSVIRPENPFDPDCYVHLCEAEEAIERLAHRRGITLKRLPISQDRSGFLPDPPEPEISTI